MLCKTPSGLPLPVASAEPSPCRHDNCLLGGAITGLGIFSNEGWPLIRCGPGFDRKELRMSTYRRPEALADQDGTSPASLATVAMMFPPSPRKAASGYAHLRKSNPVNDVLPLSRKWLARLPPDVRPTSLVKEYPRIVNFIAFAWNDAAATGMLLTDLLHDHRGGRDGSPRRFFASCGRCTITTIAFTEKAIFWSRAVRCDRQHAHPYRKPALVADRARRRPRRIAP